MELKQELLIKISVYSALKNSFAEAPSDPKDFWEFFFFFS